MCMKEDRAFAKHHLYDKIFQTEFNISFFSPKKNRCLLCESCKQLSPEIARKLESYNRKKRKKLCREEKKLCVMINKQFFQHHVVTFLSYITNVVSHAIISQYLMPWTGRVITTHGMRDLVIEVLMKLVIALIIWRKIAIHYKLYFIATTVLDRTRIDIFHVFVLFAIYKFKDTQVPHYWSYSEWRRQYAYSLEKKKKRLLKSSPITLPSHWISILRLVKKSGEPYHVKEMCYDDFLDLKKLANNMGKNFNMNENGGKVKW